MTAKQSLKSRLRYEPETGHFYWLIHYHGEFGRRAGHPSGAYGKWRRADQGRRSQAPYAALGGLPRHGREQRRVGQERRHRPPNRIWVNPR
jgi:hypothetical protein